MFEHFTERAIVTIMLAQEEARRMGHNFVGTEQILLGLIGEGQGLAARKLKSAGVTLRQARVEVEKIIGRGSGFVAVEIPFTPRSKRVLELSWAESTRLRHGFIGPEHMLLGLIREGGGVACRVLQILNVDLDRMYRVIVAQLGGDSTLPAEPIVPTDTASLIAGPFSYYTKEALVTIENALFLAATIGSNTITPEHLLLAVLKNNNTVFGVTAGVESLGRIRRELLSELKVDDASPPAIFPISPEAQTVLTYAWSEAARLERDWISTECILLGFLHEDNGSLTTLLKHLGANPDLVRERIEESIKNASDEAPSDPIEDDPPPAKAVDPIAQGVRFLQVAAGLMLLLVILFTLLPMLCH